MSCYLIWGIVYLLFYIMCDSSSFEVYCASCVMVTHLRFIVLHVSQSLIWGILYLICHGTSFEVYCYLICGLLLPHLRFIATSFEVYCYLIWGILQPDLSYIAISFEVYFYIIWARLYLLSGIFLVLVVAVPPFVNLLSFMETTGFTIWFIKQMFLTVT